MDCGYSCHEKCMESVPKNCTKYKSVADNTTSQGMQVNPGDTGSVSSGKISINYRFYLGNSMCFVRSCTMSKMILRSIVTVYYFLFYA